MFPISLLTPLTVLFLLCKNYVEGCNGRTLRLSARHGLRHVAPVRVSMYQNLSATVYVFTSIGFLNLPCLSVFDIDRHNAH